MGLVHFNADHPENQTVRKTNKKSDLMEFRSEHGWEPETCATGIPRMRNNLEHMLNTKFDDKLTDPTLRELLYHNSKRGALNEDVLLAKYNDVEFYNQMRCREESEVTLQNFKKDTLSKFSANNQKMPCVVISLQRDLNEIRRKYDQPELTLNEVAQSY
jgi:succinate dehydrogenase flavin-adding protein (antitoxin of CptAB toxin-antitoxin module)